MDRLAMAKLSAWRRKPSRKPLIVRGVRQCGKTWLLKAFGTAEYTQQVYLNFEREPSLAGLFAADLDPQRILREIALLREQTIEPDTTLLILDEIQACPAALTSLKYFAEEASQYSIAAAGSLLGLAVHGDATFPVGKVDFVDLHPMSFDEFLLAGGHEALVQYLGSLAPGKVVSAPLATKAESLLREYLMVGGMPEAITAWLDSHDIAAVEEVQQAILDSYTLDMAKHSSPAVFPKLSAIWRSVPGQLARENKKFVFSQVARGARAKDLEDALEWLVSAGIAIKVNRVAHAGIPLAAYSDDRYFKLYLADVGLLRRLANVPASVIILPSDTYPHFRGALIENYVLTQLVAAGVARPYFWRSDNSAEVDFLIQVDADVVPLEVKAEHNTASKSLAVYKRTFAPARALTLSMKPTVDGHLPLYCAWDVAGYLARLVD